MRAARMAHVDLEASLARFFREPPQWLDSSPVDTPGGIAALLNELRGTTSVTELARKAGVSRYSMSRWLSAATQPRLPDFLATLQAASLRLVDFLTVLVEPTDMPSVLPLYKQLQARREGAFKHPWTQAIVRALELEDYLRTPRHADGWIAGRLGITEDEEQRCITFLADSGQITWTGTHWRQVEVGAVDTRRQRRISRHLKSHWSNVAGERIRADRDGQFSYNVFTVSEADFERIRALHLEYYFAMRAVVAESEPGECVAVANVQLFRLDG
jgi:DNA-binding phage protein